MYDKSKFNVFLIACHSDCNVGLMRCTGTASSECCVAFEDDGMCSPDLGCDENNFVANKQNNFTCGQSAKAEHNNN